MEPEINDVEISLKETIESAKYEDHNTGLISIFQSHGAGHMQSTSKIVSLNNASVSNIELPSNKNNVDLRKSYICPECKVTFSLLKNFKRHVKHKHPSLLFSIFSSAKFRVSKKFKCNICEKSYKNMSSLKSHQRSCHNIIQSNFKEHKCPLCPQTLSAVKFNEHFEKSHNLLLKPVNLNFQSYGDFCEWKKAIERVTKSHFIKRNSRESNGITRRSFICHRSGTYKSSPKASQNNRKLKSQGSRKLDAYCPAIMKVILMKEGKCKVSFQSQHIGHENELQHLNLTYEERLYVANKLGTNLPLSDILNDIHNSASKDGAERLCLLTRKDLHNIKASLSKDKQLYLSSAKFNEKLTNDLRDIHNKHAESRHINAEIIENKNSWIIAILENNEMYLIKENLKSCDCPLVCIYCKVCTKSYSCSCSDSSIEGNMCKHIHFFCMEREKLCDDSNSNDILNCDNNDAIKVTSNSKECNCLEGNDSMLMPNKLSRKKKNIFIDFEMKNTLKNKFSDLIDLLTTEEEYKLLENAAKDLAVKLKSMQMKKNTVTPAISHSSETKHIKENAQDRQNKIPAVNHAFKIVHVGNISQQYNSFSAINHLSKIDSINENVQVQNNSNSQKSSILKLLGPSKSCYIFFAKDIKK